MDDGKKEERTEMDMEGEREGDRRESQPVLDGGAYDMRVRDEMKWYEMRVG